MEATLVETPLGILLLSDEGRILDGERFESCEEAVESLKLLSLGEPTVEVENLLSRWKDRLKVLKVLSNELALKLRERYGFKIVFEKPSRAWRIYADNPAKVLSEAGWIRSVEEYRDAVRKVGFSVAEKSVSEALTSRDLLIVQAVSAIEDVTGISNLFWSRLREWYGVHFPELESLVDDMEDYSLLVCKLGLRENFTEDSIAALGFSKNRAGKIAEEARRSVGGEIEEEDLKPIVEFASHLLSLIRLKENLTKYLEKCMRDEAPNLTSLIGPLIGAKLIARAGGLEKLAKMPASTIQVLGAEKALFRALRTGSKPPKHGIIFQHPLVHQAPRRVRGKIARALAAKLAIASRVDFYRKEDIAERLKEELKARIEEIKREGR